MQIVSYIQDSYQEYEDLHSLVLFSKGCNFKCKDCYNLQAITHSEPIGKAIDIMKAKITPLHEGVVFLGGEPTIWGDRLIESALFAKNEMKMKVKVFSNGYKTDIIRKLIEKNCVDVFSFDYKCTNNTVDVLGINITEKQYQNAVINSINTAKEAGINIEIRTTEFDNVDISGIKKILNEKFPDVRHIIQEPFEFANKELIVA